MFRKIWFWLVPGMCLVLLIAVKEYWWHPSSIDNLFNKILLQRALGEPEMLSRLAPLDRFGLDFYNDDLNDRSEERISEDYALARENLRTLRDWNPVDLSSQEDLSRRILIWFLQDMVDGEAWRYHRYPVNQMFGVQSELPTFLATIHQISDSSDADNYLARLQQVALALEQTIASLEHRRKRGVLPPTFVIDRVLDEMRDFIAAPPEANILYASFAERLGAAGIEDTDHWLRPAAAVISRSVYPAYERLIEWFVRVRPQTDNRAGVWKLPDGDAYYAWLLRHHTTTDRKPAQIHQTGLDEVERIQGQMREILQNLGYEGSDVGQIMAELGEDPRFLYADTDAGRQQILLDYQAIVDEIGVGLDAFFLTKPRAGVKVRRIPVFKEKTSAGAYYNGPAMDGSRPGIFYANLHDIKATPKFGMRTLAYHEAIPGHHLQIAIQREQAGLPFFRRVLPFTAYSEGWALYAERLAWEAGFHKDPYSNLGRLTAELFRAVRLVVDTGIHYRRWTREEAIAYMRGNTGMAMSDVTAEIERYIVMPGQATAYKTGMMHILHLRERARTGLGKNFDIRKFHDLVLRGGSVPLGILEEVVGAWIREQRRLHLSDSGAGEGAESG